MNCHKKFIYRFLFVIIYFLIFEAININPAFNSNSTGAFIQKSVDDIDQTVFSKDKLATIISELDMNGIARILAHVLVFGCLSLIIIWALNVYDISDFYKILISIVICSLFGLIDETIQLFIPYRQFRYIDVLKDDVGAIIFTCFIYSPLRNLYHTQKHRFLKLV